MPQHEKMPGKWDKLTRFEQLVILRCVRPDAVVPTAAEFVEAEMSKQYVEPPPRM